MKSPKFSTRRDPTPYVFAGLLVLTLAAYFPVWHGGPVWDDDAHLTRLDLRSLHGLWRIWFDLGATQQYYPAAHSAFWLMHRLWGADTLGYHLVNIVLHATSACLLLVILRRLAVPGAVLAALIFAVHPVHVESVAWMTELKNTLSGACYLAAALAYLRFDTSRRRAPYLLALGFFVVALLGKTVTATLPAALLVVFWWQRGRLRPREDTQPLVPFFVLGLGAGLLTAWVERAHIGAEGAPFQFTILERMLIAGRAIWFYLGKLVWPSDLIFVYPRWELNPRDWLQWLYPIGVVAVLAAFWFWRRRSRAPLAGALFFVGTLFPALGFFNVYPFLYSFVADHFQYLASLGVIVPVSAGLARLSAQRRLRPAMAAAIVVVAIGAPATVLTWQQSRQYADVETLYRTTLDRNPASWMAHSNLGLVLQQTAGDTDVSALEEAIGHYREAIRLRPDYPQAHNNLAGALLALKRFDEAKAEYAEALRLRPNDLEIRRNSGELFRTAGAALQAAGKLDEAVAAYREGLRVFPDDSETHLNLGSALGRLGRLDEAVAEYGETLRLNPSSSKANRNLGVALLRLGRTDDAVARFRDALRLDPSAEARADLAGALNELGITLAERGRFPDAVKAFRDALELTPEAADIRANLARALAMIK